MIADKIIIDRSGSQERHGRVLCPQEGITLPESICLKCKYLRIAEYEYIKCLYRQVQENKDKIISI